jgi:hypothetical protein
MSEDKKTLSLFGAGTALSTSAQSVASKLGHAVAMARASGGGGRPEHDLMTFDYQTGEFSFGLDRVIPEEDALVVVGVETMMHGLICWPAVGSGTDRKPLGQVMVPMTGEDAPDPAKLPNHGQPWQRAYSFDVIFVTGEDKETRVTFKGNSGGTHDGVMELASKIARQYNADPERVNPIVRLGETHYPSRYKNNAFIYKPHFEVVGWIGPGDDLDEVIASITGGPSPAPAAAPAEPVQAARGRNGNKPAPETPSRPASVRQRRQPGAQA